MLLICHDLPGIARVDSHRVQWQPPYRSNLWLGGPFRLSETVASSLLRSVPARGPTAPAAPGSRSSDRPSCRP